MSNKHLTEYRYEKLTWPEINDAIAARPRSQNIANWGNSRFRLSRPIGAIIVLIGATVVPSQHVAEGTFASTGAVVMLATGRWSRLQ